MTENNTIKLFYHVGAYAPRNPVKTLGNLIKYQKPYKPSYNVGDQISSIVLEKLSGMKVRHVNPKTRGKMLAIGSVLGAIQDQDVVWGTGAMIAEHTRLATKAKDPKILAVRGPETQKALIANGVDCPPIFGDPGLLVSRLFPQQRKSDFEFGIIPHQHQIKEFEQIIGTVSQDRILLLNPNIEWTTFLEQLCRCQVILSSSLHGVIFAESYGIPALLIKHKKWPGKQDDPFKFVDYYHSTHRELTFINSNEILNADKATTLLEQLGKPNIDLGPLLTAFPYPLKIDGTFSIPAS